MSIDDLDFAATNLLQSLPHPWFDQHGIRVQILRLDRLDPVISGNKWFKLKQNLIEARRRKVDHLLSFGGPWSNHLHALAAAGARFGFRTTALVRGEQVSNGMLADARAWGMDLHFVDRATYRRRYDTEFLDELSQRHGPVYIVPEGGNNLSGVRGCVEIGQRLMALTGGDFDQVWLAAGTACTAAGLISSLSADKLVQVVSVLKGDAGYHGAEIDRWLQQLACRNGARWRVNSAYHRGGYGHCDAWLWSLIQAACRDFGLPLDPVYTGKLWWAFLDQVSRGLLPSGTRLVLVHTGGLQGLRGFQGKYDDLGRPNAIDSTVQLIQDAGAC